MQQSSKDTIEWFEKTTSSRNNNVLCSYNLRKSNSNTIAEVDILVYTNPKLEDIELAIVNTWHYETGYHHREYLLFKTHTFKLLQNLNIDALRILYEKKPKEN